MVESLKDMKEKRDIINMVYNKLCKQHNSDYNQLWLQNITYTQDKKRKKSPYTIRLCKLVMGNTDEPLWNNSWIKPDLVENMPFDSIVNQKTLELVTPVIVFRETRAYNEQTHNTWGSSECRWCDWQKGFLIFLILIIMSVTLLPQQQTAFDEIQSFLKNDGDIFMLKGYAGTGKTTMIKYIVD